MTRRWEDGDLRRRVIAALARALAAEVRRDIVGEKLRNSPNVLELTDRKLRMVIRSPEES